MKKEGEVNLPLIIIFVFGAVALALGVYVYFALNGPDYTASYIQRISEGKIQNPISEFQLSEENESLSDIIHLEEIQGLDLEELKEKSINYMSVKLYLYNLHNIPLTNNNPRVQIYLDDTPYSIEVIQGEIYVRQEVINSPDIIIRATLEEVAKIIDNPEYTKGALNSGKIQIEIVSSYLELALKGYYKIYSKLSNL